MSHILQKGSAVQAGEVRTGLSPWARSMWMQGIDSLLFLLLPCPPTECKYKLYGEWMWQCFENFEHRDRGQNLKNHQTDNEVPNFFLSCIAWPVLKKD